MELLSRRNLALLGGTAVLAGLYLASRYNYLFFHYVAELFSIVVAAGIFIVTWNARRYLDNHYFLFIGIAYLFVGTLDVVHTLSYKGMLIFPGYGTNLPTQLWIAARYMQSISLLVAPVFVGRRINANYAFTAYASILVLLLTSIFYWKVFPVCFIEGVGLTPFKKTSEYIISLILVASIYTLYKKSSSFDKKVVRLLYAAILTTIASELAFTFYVSAYGFSNLVGHYLKIVSFFLIYRAVIVTGLREPYNLLFRNLKQSEEALRRHQEQLEEMVWERTKEIQAVNFLLELASRESSRDAYLGEVAELLSHWSGCRCVGIRVLDEKGNIPYGTYLGYSQEFWESENALVVGRDHCACTRVIEGRPEPQDARAMTHFGSFRTDNVGEFIAGLTGDEKARYRGVCATSGFNSLAVIPIRYEDRTIGAVHLADEQKGKMPLATVEFIENLTPIIGEALNKLDLEQKLKENYVELMSTNEELELEISERTKAEAQLLQSQKMEAVGQLAGGIAHDFNNRLFAIRNYAHILKSTVDDRAAVETAEKILASCDKAADLVDDLLRFSRKKEINPRPADLNSIVGEAESLLRVSIGKSIKFEVELSDRPLVVMADATQVEHILINIVTNARDAMPDGGKLSVRTARAEAETVSGAIHSGGHPGPFGEIYVSDTGPGMDEKTKEKIFEPFFTTKEIGKGTGLGLSTVYGVVRQHNGFIEVQSQPGEGTTFRIFLPLI